MNVFVTLSTNQITLSLLRYAGKKSWMIFQFSNIWQYEINEFAVNVDRLNCLSMKKYAELLWNVVCQIFAVVVVQFTIIVCVVLQFDLNIKSLKAFNVKEFELKKLSIEETHDRNLAWFVDTHHEFTSKSTCHACQLLWFHKILYLCQEVAILNQNFTSKFVVIFGIRQESR